MKVLSGQRIVVIYSGVLTAAFAATLLSGSAPQQDQAESGRATFREINVQRINIVEPDGTLRLILTNRARVPGIYVKGQEYLAGQRAVAGLIFLNDEGTENGGLTFSGRADEQGVPHSSGHLSFDDYMQDQTLTFTHQQDGTDRSTRLTMIDRPDWSILEFLELLEEIENLPPAEQQQRINDFLATHASAFQRVRLGRSPDRSVALQLKDTAGRDRIVLRVDPDGTPRMLFLDENGNVVSQLP